MKAAIVLLISFLIIGCGSRTKQTEKKLLKIKEEIKTVENSEKQTQSSVSIQSDTEVKKIDILQQKEAESKSVESNIESNTQKNKSENNSKYLKKTEYYPNGQKKSEVEMSEKYSKISEEKDYYKRRSEEYKAKLNASIKIQDSIYKQNLIAVKNNKDLVKINKESLSKIDAYGKQLKKAIEREGLSFGSVVWIVIISFIAGGIFVQIIKNYIPVWIVNLFTKK